MPSRGFHTSRDFWQGEFTFPLDLTTKKPKYTLFFFTHFFLTFKLFPKVSRSKKYRPRLPAPVFETEETIWILTQRKTELFSSFSVWIIEMMLEI